MQVFPYVATQTAVQQNQMFMSKDSSSCVLLDIRVGDRGCLETDARPLVRSQVSPCLRRRDFKLSPCLCSHLSLQPQQATWFPPGCGFLGARRSGAAPPPRAPWASSGTYSGIPHSGLPEHTPLIRRGPRPERETPGRKTLAAAADLDPARPTLFLHAPGAAEEPARGCRARGLPRCAARLAPRALRGPGGGGGRRASSGAGGRKRARGENGAERRA